MATPAPGTIPALPQYQPGALPLTGQEVLEIASSATATAAISAQMPLTDVVGKVPSVMTAATPGVNDLIAFYQVASGLPKQCPIGNLNQAAGNLPIAGNTGQLLAKNSGANFDDSWYNLSTFLAAGTAVVLSGSTTVTVGISITGAVTISATGTASIANIAQAILTTGSVYTTVTSVREVYIATTTLSNVRITAATTWFAADTNGLPLIVADVTGTAAAHNVTLTFLNDTCNGTSTLKITTNYGGYRLRPLATGNWVMV